MIIALGHRNNQLTVELCTDGARKRGCRNSHTTAETNAQHKSHYSVMLSIFDYM